MVVALVSTILIGMGLTRLHFEPGMPLPSFDRNQVVIPGSNGTPDVGMPVNQLVVVVLLVAAAIGLAIALYRIIRGTNWKELFSTFLATFMITMLFLAFMALIFSSLPKSDVPLAPEPIPIPTPLRTSPLGPVPPYVLWIVGIGLVLVAALLGAWIFNPKRRPAPAGWELEAENARQALLAGDDMKNVILRCYQQMSRALEKEQQIERAVFMTTGEFERLLTEEGVPQQPVHQLTQLFDAVRYGHWEPKPGDEHKALACLDAILEYSREVQHAV